MLYRQCISRDAVDGTHLQRDVWGTGGVICVTMPAGSFGGYVDPAHGAGAIF